MSASGYITAILPSVDRAAEAVNELTHVGVLTDEICAATESSRSLLAFCHDMHVVPLEQGVKDQLREAGLSEDRARDCDDAINTGATMLLVRVQENPDAMLDVLRTMGADAVFTELSDRTLVRLREERLDARTRRVKDGDVIIRKVVTEAIQHVEVPVVSEELVITQKPASGKQKTFRIPLEHDEIEVSKRRVVGNEVHLSKEVVRTMRRISRPVLRERLVVREDGPLVTQRRSEFDATSEGNTTSSSIENIPMENDMDLQDDRAMSAYFPDRISAESAAEELRAQGAAADDISVETSGHNFLDAVKRLFGGETDTSERGGAVIKMRGNLSSAAPIVERYGGQIADGAAQESDGGRMTLHEEQLDVQKHEAKQGEVRLTKQVVTDQKEIDVPVNREEVILSRHKIDEPDDDATIGEGEDIRIPVMRDEVDVDKRTVATEEVGVEKRDVQSTEHVSAAVQKERARLETDGRVGTTLDDER